MLRRNRCNSGYKTPVFIFNIKTTNSKINKTAAQNTAKSTIIYQKGFKSCVSTSSKPHTRLTAFRQITSKFDTSLLFKLQSWLPLKNDKS